MKRLFLALLLLTVAVSATGQTSFDITYQGRLLQNGQPFTGTADFEFSVHNADEGGTQLGAALQEDNWPVEDGLFQIPLSLAGMSIFPGSSDRYLEVKVNGTTLSPRQLLTSAPFARWALGPWSINSDAQLRYTAGAVGIGVGNPVARLHVDALDPGEHAFRARVDGTTRLLVHSNGNVRVGAGTVARQQLSVGTALDLYSGPINDPTVPSIRGRTNGNLILNAADGGDIFLNHDTGLGGGAVRFYSGRPESQGGSELMRITPEGQLLIGTTSSASSTKLRVAGGGWAVFDNLRKIEWTTLPFVGGEVCRDAPGILNDCGSSQRLKRDIVEIEDASALLQALRPVRFSWIANGAEDLGLIAEEVVEVLPELITYGSDGQVSGVKYRHLTAVLIKAMQERRQVVDTALAERDAQIAALRDELERERAEMGERLAALEALLTGERQLVGGGQ